MDQAALEGFATIAKTLRDGTIRLSVDVPHEYAKVVGQHLMSPDTPIALAVMNKAIAANDEEPPKADYGQHAMRLKQSGFFRIPDVWRAIVTDDQYLEWLKSQKCCVPSHHKTQCSGDNVAAHVRRVSNGSGTAIKPPYSAIPLCDFHHRLQHNSGESRIADREWWDTQRIVWIEGCCWETLKYELGFASWSQVPPEILQDWAQQNDLYRFLPKEYRDA